MLIKKIEIENFRQYVGKQTIEFSTDKDKNVTLVIGKNGAGKTVISQAFIWCLYGETPGFNKKDSLLSVTVENNMYDGFFCPVNVTIYMEHTKKEYKISRTIIYKKMNGRIITNVPSFSITMTDEFGTKFPNEKIINEILPKELSQYFFLSGEKIDNMAMDIRKGSPKDFANAVNTLLDLDYLKNAIKHLKNISREFYLENPSGLDTELESVTTSIKYGEEKITEHKNFLKNLDISQEHFEEISIDCRAKLKNMLSSKEIQIKIENNEDKLKNAKHFIDNEVKTGITNFVQKMPFAFFSNVINKVNNTIDEITKMPTDDIPERLHADLIDWIEKHGKCICGTSITENDECYKFLEKWRNIVPPEAIGTLASNLKKNINSNITRGDGLVNIFDNCYDAIDSKENDIEEYENAIDKLKEELSNAQDTTNIQNTLYNATEELKTIREKRKDTQHQLDLKKLDLERAKKAREKIIINNKEGQRILKWQETTDLLVKKFENTLSEQEKLKKDALTNSVKEAFKNIYGTSFSIEIDDNYRIVTDNNLEKSTGQGMAVIFSFLAGLLDVIKQDNAKNQNNKEHIELESYPLVFDAPFSALDTQRITSICKVLPKVSEQIIIFIKDTDGDLVRQEMKDKIGCSYILTKIGNNDVETKIEREE